jgi:hypothetical protein
VKHSRHNLRIPFVSDFLNVLILIISPPEPLREGAIPLSTESYF